MIADPAARGRALASFCAELTPRLFQDLEGAGLLPNGPDALRRARLEWECFALYACVRGLVAAGGFNRETNAAVDAMHETFMTPWASDPAESLPERRARVAERYAEYGAIGQAGGASGAATVTRRLGEAAARHMAASPEAPAALAETVGALHEALVEGAASAVREAADE